MTTMNAQFTAPAVRHLTWCLLSPAITQLNIAESLSVDETSELMFWLNSLEQDPSELNAYIQHRNHHLLGSYFECLWAFYFEFGPNNHLIADHFQVTDEKRTLGELDALASLNKHDTHIELAVKFYLLQPHHSGEETHHWVGPQSRDRLDIKIQTLNEKQFPFLQHPATINALKKHSLPCLYKQALAFKGYLFPQYQTSYALPENSKTSLHHASWIYSSDALQTLLAHNDKPLHWSLLPKHEWLGPFFTNDEKEIMTTGQAFQQVTDHFYPKDTEESPYALMLVNMIKHDGDGYLEQQRFFIVHDQWPNAFHRRE